MGARTTGRLAAAAVGALALLAIVGVGAQLLGSRDAGASGTEGRVASAAEVARDISVALGRFHIVDDGLGGRQATLPVTITNNGTTTRHFRTTIQATGPDGVVLGVDSLSVQDLAPGQSIVRTAFVGAPPEQIKAFRAAAFFVIGSEGELPFR